MGSAILAGGLPLPQDEGWGGAKAGQGLSQLGGRGGGRLRAQGRQGAKSHPRGPSPMPDAGLALVAAPLQIKPRQFSLQGGWVRCPELIEGAMGVDGCQVSLFSSENAKWGLISGF